MRVLTASAATLAAAIFFMSAADVAIADTPYPTQLPSGQRCVGLGEQTKVISAVTQVQHWCDPQDQDRLQVDLHIKTAAGDAGSYLVSYKNYGCNLPQVPASVKAEFC